MFRASGKIFSRVSSTLAAFSVFIVFVSVSSFFIFPLSCTFGSCRQSSFHLPPLNPVPQGNKPKNKVTMGHAVMFKIKNQKKKQKKF
jgi:hypothetical protein